MKKYIPREIYKKIIDRYVGKEIIKVLIGQRRVGKSYLLFQVIDSIKEKYLHLKAIGYSVLFGKQNGKEIDFIGERQ